MIPIKICLLAPLLLIPFLASGQTYHTDSSHAEFTGHTPVFSFEGSSDSLQGTVNVTDSTVRFQLPVKSIDTGNGKRNSDMMETMDVDQHPYVKFNGKIVTPLNPDGSSQQQVTVKGQFTAHGISQSLNISGTRKFTQNKLKISASWPLKLADYNIEPPSVLFYHMKDQIEVRIHSTLSRATQE